MPVSIRLYRRFPVHCAVTHNAESSIIHLPKGPREIPEKPRAAP